MHNYSNFNGNNDMMDGFFKYIFPVMFVGVFFFIVVITPCAMYMSAKAKQKVMAAKGIEMTIWEAAAVPDASVQDIGVKVR